MTIDQKRTLIRMAVARQDQIDVCRFENRIHVLAHFFELDFGV
jgi:hypothetical protein